VRDRQLASLLGKGNLAWQKGGLRSEKIKTFGWRDVTSVLSRKFSSPRELKKLKGSPDNTVYPADLQKPETDFFCNEREA